MSTKWATEWQEGVPFDLKVSCLVYSTEYNTATGGNLIDFATAANQGRAMTDWLAYIDSIKDNNFDYLIVDDGHGAGFDSWVRAGSWTDEITPAQMMEAARDRLRQHKGKLIPCGFYGQGEDLPGSDFIYTPIHRIDNREANWTAATTAQASSTPVSSELGTKKPIYAQINLQRDLQTQPYRHLDASEMLLQQEFFVPKLYEGAETITPDALIDVLVSWTSEAGTNPTSSAAPRYSIARLVDQIKRYQLGMKQLYIGSAP